MKTKSLLLVMVLLVAFSATTLAQRNSGIRPSQSENYQKKGPARLSPEERVERQTKRLTEELGLSVEQTTKIKTILQKESEDQQAQFEKMKSKSQEEKEAMREKMMANREAMRKQMDLKRAEQDTKIKKVLTSEQKVKYEKMQAERAANREAGRHNGGT